MQRISVLAPPGTYTVKLSVDGKEFSQPLRVIKDPHSNGTEGDITVQTRLMDALSDDMNNIADQVNQIEMIRAQLSVLEAEVAPDQNGSAIRTAAEQLNSKLAGIEEHLISLPVTGKRGRWAMGEPAGGKNSLSCQRSR